MSIKKKFVEKQEIVETEPNQLPNSDKTTERGLEKPVQKTSRDVPTSPRSPLQSPSVDKETAIKEAMSEYDGTFTVPHLLRAILTELVRIRVARF